MEALFSALDKAIQTLDELLAESKPGQTISYQTSRDLTDARSSGDSIDKLHHSRQMKNQPEHS
jgi:hypothetical protein